MTIEKVIRYKEQYRQIYTNINLYKIYSQIYVNIDKGNIYNYLYVGENYEYND